MNPSRSSWSLLARHLILAAVLVLGAATPALPQSWFDNWGRCTNVKLPPDRRIGYCSRLIYNGGGPNHEIAVFVTLGGIYRDQHQYPKALDFYNRAMAYESIGTSKHDEALVSPDALIGALVARSELYAMTGQHDLALADAAHILQLASDQAAAYAERCKLRAIMKVELDQAEADCSEAMKRDPRNTQALDAAGLLQFRMGNLKQAAADYDAALGLDGRLLGALYMRGIIKLRNGDTAGGNADIATAKDGDPALAGRFADMGISP
jgi:tetratricopeptide (TPR) repeat protein